MKQKWRKANNHMQYDDQQQEIDPIGQGNPLDFPRAKVRGKADDVIDRSGSRVPGSEQYTDQGRQASGQGFDPPQQGPGNLGGIGNMAGRQPDLSRAKASDDPNNPYGEVDDVIADYGNRSRGQGQQGVDV